MNVKEFVSDCRKIRVLVLGDIILDHYTEGNVLRVSPEAPVPVVNVTRDYHVLGGAGNVAAVLSTLGAHVELFGLIGSDPQGQMIKKIAKEVRIGTRGVLVDRERRTAHKQRIVSGQQIVRIDRESVEPLTFLQVENLMSRFLSRLPFADAVIVSDYAKGVISQNLLDRLITACREANTFVAINAKPGRGLIPSGTNLITLNRTEAFAMAKTQDDGDHTSVVRAARLVRDANSADNVLITLGREGMLLLTRRHRQDDFVRVSADAVAVSDVSGAGDTVIAVTTLGVCLTKDIRSSVRLANKAAGIVVSKPGTAVVLPEELCRVAGAV